MRSVSRGVSRMMIPTNRPIKQYDDTVNNKDEFEDWFDPCDFRCDSTKPGNFPYFIILISLVDIAIFTYYYALPKDDPETDPYNIDGFNM